MTDVLLPDISNFTLFTAKLLGEDEVVAEALMAVEALGFAEVTLPKELWFSDDVLVGIGFAHIFTLAVQLWFSEAAHEGLAFADMIVMKELSFEESFMEKWSGLIESLLETSLGLREAVMAAFSFEELSMSTLEFAYAMRAESAGFSKAVRAELLRPVEVLMGKLEISVALDGLLRLGEASMWTLLKSNAEEGMTKLGFTTAGVALADIQR